MRGPEPRALPLGDAPMRPAWNSTLFFLGAGPGVLHGDDAVEDQGAGLAVLHVDHEIALALELEALARLGFAEASLQLAAGHDRQGIRVDRLQEVTVLPGRRGFLRQQAIVEPYFRVDRVASAHPVNRPFDLAPFRVPAQGFRVVPAA